MVLDPCLKYYSIVFRYACEVRNLKMMQVCNSKGKYRVEGVSRVWVRDRVLG